MINLTDENFDKEIQNNTKPVLVDFWAEWCGACTMLGPVLEKVSQDYKERIIFCKANVDLAPVSSQKFSISQIPTVIMLKGGKLVGTFIGSRPEEFIKQWLDENLK